MKIVKSKLGGDYLEVIEVPFVFGQGFATGLDIESVAKDLGILAHSAGQSQIIWVPDGEKQPLLPDIDRGKAAAQHAIMTKPWLLHKLREACFLHANADCALTPEEVLAIGPDMDEVLSD